MLYFYIDFLVGWGATSAVQNFGEPTTKAQLLNLIRSIRTVAKSKYKFKRILIKIIANYLIINRPNIFFSVPLIFLNIVAIVIKLILG